jgi:hypothetical protein
MGAAMRKAFFIKKLLTCKITRKWTNDYQYAANMRPYDQINNSFFMNEMNTMLQKAGLGTMPHGMLDHAAQRMQPEHELDSFFQ